MAKSKKTKQEPVAVVHERPKDIQLKTDSQRERLLRLFDGTNVLSDEETAEREGIIQHSEIDKYLRELSQSPLRVGSDHVFVAENVTPAHADTPSEYNMILVRKREVYSLCLNLDRIDQIVRRAKDARDSNYSYTPAALVYTKGHRIEANKGMRLMLLVNGDEDTPCPYNSLVGESLDKHEFPTVSFRCLGRFYAKDSDTTELQGINRMVKKFVEGTLTVIDYSPDRTLPVSPQDRKEISKWRKKASQGAPCPVKPPEFGFTLTGRGTGQQWHQSATVLLFDSEQEMCILIGQDEGTYFGVQLAGQPKSLSTAYKDLMPPEVRKMPNVPRQGEWFLVPVDEKDVPPAEDCALLWNGNCTGDPPCLPREPDGNEHWISTDDGRVTKDGRVLAYNPTLIHSEHNDCSADGWTTFLRNTAVRSFSVEGVD